MTSEYHSHVTQWIYDVARRSVQGRPTPPTSTRCWSRLSIYYRTLPGGLNGKNQKIGGDWIQNALNNPHYALFSSINLLLYLFMFTIKHPGRVLTDELYRSLRVQVIKFSFACFSGTEIKIPIHILESRANETPPRFKVFLCRGYLLLTQENNTSWPTRVVKLYVLLEWPDMAPIAAGYIHHVSSSITPPQTTQRVFIPIPHSMEVAPDSIVKSVIDRLWPSGRRQHPPQHLGDRVRRARGAGDRAACVWVCQ